MDNLLSIEEAAKRLGGISLWTVRAWLTQGRLQRTKVGGRTMIRESELARVIEDGGKSRRQDDESPKGPEGLKAVTSAPRPSIGQKPRKPVTSVGREG